MVPIVDYPPVVQRYLPHFRPHFANEPQFKHFAEYLTGLIVCWKFSVAFMNSQFVGHRDPSTKIKFLTDRESLNITTTAAAPTWWVMRWSTPI